MKKPLNNISEEKILEAIRKGVADGIREAMPSQAKIEHILEYSIRGSLPCSDHVLTAIYDAHKGER